MTDLVAPPPARSRRRRAPAFIAGWVALWLLSGCVTAPVAETPPAAEIDDTLREAAGSPVAAPEDERAADSAPLPIAASDTSTAPDLGPAPPDQLLPNEAGGPQMTRLPAPTVLDEADLALLRPEPQPRGPIALIPADPPARPPLAPIGEERERLRTALSNDAPGPEGTPPPAVATPDRAPVAAPVSEPTPAPAPAPLPVPAPDPADRPVAPSSIAAQPPASVADESATPPVPPEEERPQATPAPSAAPAPLVPPVPPIAPTQPVVTVATGSREVASGRRFSVRLPGRSWIFVGSDGDIELLGRRTERETTLFDFRAGPAGNDAELRFESQDLATGAREIFVERVTVDAPDAATPALVRTDPDATSSEAAGQAVAPEAASAASGQSPDAPQVTGTTDSDPPAPEATDGSDELPPVREVETILAGTSAPDEAELAAVAAALGSDAPALAEVAPETLAAFLERTVAAAESDALPPEAVARLLEEFLERGYQPRDAILRLLASLHDLEGPARDLRRARSLYAELVDDYPLSPYWEPARERIEFLDRHFLNLR